jgi:hypothetical protein
MLIGQARAP